MSPKKKNLFKSLLLMLGVGVVFMVYKEKIMPHLAKIPVIGDKITELSNSQTQPAA